MSKPAMIDEEKEEELSFDGKGINGPMPNRYRMATFTSACCDKEVEKYGPLFAAAPDMLAELKVQLDITEAWIKDVEPFDLMDGQGDATYQAAKENKRRLEEIIKKAEEGTK